MKLTETIGDVKVTICDSTNTINLDGYRSDQYGDRMVVDETIHFRDNEQFDDFLRFFAVFRELKKIRDNT